MAESECRTAPELEAGLPIIRRAPSSDGRLEMIVRRPRNGERELVNDAELEVSGGLIGDNWAFRHSSMTPDGSPHPEMQLNVIGSRAIDLIAGDRQRWPLAGDQLYIDIDLSTENCPPGTRLAVGESIIEVTAIPHTGCGKFSRRFGPDAARFVNSKEGKRLNLRGVNARVVQSGTIHVGDAVRKV